jgi:hypothetical protein
MTFGRASEPLAIRAERNSYPAIVGIRCSNPADKLAGGRIPQPDITIKAVCTGQQFAIWAERNLVYAVVGCE